MKKVIIFGNRDTAQLAKYYFENDEKYSDYKVVAFTVDNKYREGDTFEGLPLVPFENVENIYNIKDHLLFAPLTGAKMNKVRESVYSRGKEKGYKFCSYISSHAKIFTTNIGENCFILENNTLQPYVKVGNNVVMWSGNHIGHHSTIGDNVFFTSHVVLSGHCEVGNNSWFGVNSTIRDFTKIAQKTLVAMGAMITRDTEENGFYLGCPAKIQVKKSTEII